jgi:hypothetical protein
MSVIATYILGAASGPIPEDPLRADFDMDLWKSINSGLRLRSKIRRVYWKGLSRNFGPQYVLHPSRSYSTKYLHNRNPSLYGGSTVPKNDDITIVTLNDVQVGMIKNPLLFYHTEANPSLVPCATIVSFIELLGPEISPNPMISVQGVKALMSDASRAIAERLSKDLIAFDTIKRGDPFNNDSIFVHRFQWDWPTYRNMSPPIPISRSPLSALPISPEYLARTASDTTLTSDVDCSASNPCNASKATITPNFDRSFGNPFTMMVSPWSNDHRWKVRR